MNVAIYLILLFVGIGFLVIIHVCIVGRAFRRGFMNASTAIESSGRFGSTSMSQDDLERLPSFDFKAREKGSSPVDCAVCLDNFKVGEKCRLLPLCKHSFHAQCVDLWLVKTPICPICRTSTDSWKGGSVSGDESGHFSGIELRESQTTEWESRESQTAEIDNFLALEIDHLSESGIEATESQAVSEVGVGENQTSLLVGSPL
ncbi:hypothetical protein CsSME_00005055 [Camellia sinensis var. sinensis]|nr:RING-H2 finger protein ATL39-like [Camellia sinensis]